VPRPDPSQGLPGAAPRGIPRATQGAPPIDPFLIAAIVLIVIISLALHDAAHAWVAYRCGDPTAKDLGRLTLNPIPSIDPIMTILLPGFLLLSGSGILFGGAKPVPVDYYRLRHPARNMMYVALAGPLSNILIAVLLMLVIKVLVYIGGMPPDNMTVVALTYGMRFNLIIAIFNMLPVPPLDGSRVLNWLLPESMRPAFASLERFSLLFVIVLVFVFGRQLFAVLRAVYGPLADLIDLVTGGIW
jgi:Zn-dependent protease